MKPLERVTLALPGGQQRPDETPLRVFDAYDRFVAALRAEMHARVEIYDGPLDETPSDGMLLIARPAADETSGLIARLGSSDPRPLLLNVSPSAREELVQTVAPAGFVLSDRYGRWRLGQDELTRQHLYGLTSLAASLAPDIVPHDEGRHAGYAMYESEDALRLPAVVSRYIDAYWRSLP